MSEIALILAGHGSHISPNTAGIVWQTVDRLRQWAVAEEITASFWKEPPAFRHVIDTVTAKQIVMVPVFTAQGYFTQNVIPQEIGLVAGEANKEGKTIRLTRTIGEHPMMEEIVQGLILETMNAQGLTAKETAVAIIGHGTRRNPHSREATKHQAAQLRDRQLVQEVTDVYLDDEPEIPSIYRSTTARNIIALPFFLATGSHVGIDVPRALGMAGSATPQRVQGRNIYYTDPVGIDDKISQVILELARETGLPFQKNESAEAWTGFPQAGRDTLLRALEEKQTLRFGQLSVSGKRVWHGEKAERGRAFSSPAQLRAFLRDDPFRSLPTSDDLPTGWRVDLEHPAQAHAVLETVYPGLVADWAARRAGKFATEALKEVSARQQGMFRGIHRLASDVIEKTIAKVCGNCIRQPTWWKDDRGSELPCKAACNLWLTTAMQSREKVL